MPNRILRDWTDSETMDQLDAYTERFFTRLIMKVDDYGRFSANTKVLKANLFMLKADVRDSDVSRWLDECQKAGLISIYEVNAKSYLQITNFKQQLRQKKGKYPPPGNCCADDKQTLLNGVSETKGNESESETESETERKGTNPQAFGGGVWNAYPCEDELNIELSIEEIAKTIEFMYCMGKGDFKVNQITNKWIAFKINNFSGSKYYAKRSDCVGHFRNWLKDQKPDVETAQVRKDHSGNQW